MAGEKELEELIRMLKQCRDHQCNVCWNLVYSCLDAYLAKKKESGEKKLTCPHCGFTTTIVGRPGNIKCSCGFRWEMTDSLPVPLLPFGEHALIDFRAVSRENRDTINEIIRALALHFGKEGK